VPEFDVTAHIVLDDFGAAGRVYRETPELIGFRHGTPSVCPDTSQCQAALLGSGRLVKIAHLDGSAYILPQQKKPSINRRRVRREVADIEHRSM
jgi:hypothetical protein